MHEQASIQMNNTWVCVSLCELWVLNVHVAACQTALCTQRSVGLIDCNNGTNSIMTTKIRVYLCDAMACWSSSIRGEVGKITHEHQILQTSLLQIADGDQG